jgi:5'-3' exonuclease
MSRRPPKKGTQVTQVTNTLLVDGNALFKVGYHGAKDEYNRHGQHIGGIYQFITIVRKLLNENIYHRVFVFWDGDFSGKLRWEIYPDYKSGRGKDYINGTRPDDENQIIERYIVQGFMNDLYVRQIDDDNIVEGDDYIAFYCKTKEANDMVTICTNDRDLCQLISEDVQIYLCDKKSYVTYYNFNQHKNPKKVSLFDFNLRNTVLVKTLCGDASDSIRGVKGLKEKTLLTYFPQMANRVVTLEEVLEQAKELQAERLDNKKKPLKVLDAIMSGTTTTMPDKNGESKIVIMGMDLYNRNRVLVDLSLPMMTKESIIKLEDLKNGYFDTNTGGIKEAYTKMKDFGLDVKVGQIGIEYLMPFKKLIEREKRGLINN